jgi:hypothetical protein
MFHSATLCQGHGLCHEKITQKLYSLMFQNETPLFPVTAFSNGISSKSRESQTGTVIVSSVCKGEQRWQISFNGLDIFGAGKAR